MRVAGSELQVSQFEPLAASIRTFLGAKSAPSQKGF